MHGKKFQWHKLQSYTKWNHYWTKKCPKLHNNLYHLYHICHLYHPNHINYLYHIYIVHHVISSFIIWYHVIHFFNVLSAWNYLIWKYNVNCVKRIFERVLLYGSIKLLHTLLQFKNNKKGRNINCTNFVLRPNFRQRKNIKIEAQW